MTPRPILYFLIAFLILGGPQCYLEAGNARGRDYVLLRVAVVKDKDFIDLGIKGSFKIEALNTGAVLEEKRNLKITKIVPTNAGLIFGKDNFKIYGIRIVPRKNASIYIDNRRFRGLVDIIRTENIKILVINHVHVEDYLYGVLYHEVSHFWPMETLKAQAIAARTYALYQKIKRINEDYDLTSDVYSQVYGGKTSERWRTNRAVNLTQGKILVYKGEIFPAYYHATCGGHTEDADRVWNINLEALKGRPCPYCRFSPHYEWRAVFSYRQIEDCLNKYGFNFKKISFIAMGARDKSGRLEGVKLKDKRGVKEIPAKTFRLALGANTIKSANFTIEITYRGVIFDGLGWGHGVGMCQWGAFGMARKRHRAEDILAFYYKGAKIEDYVKVVRF